MTINGFLGYLQIFGNLSVGHAADGFHNDLGIEVGHLLPVGCGEGLCTEASFTGLTCKPLDTVGWSKSSEETDLLERPRIAGVVVVFAFGVGAEGRGP